MDKRKLDPEAKKLMEKIDPTKLQGDTEAVKQVQTEIEEGFLVEDEEELKATKKEKENTYEEVIQDIPELKQDLDYLIITNKIKKGDRITKKEKEFKAVYEEAKRKEIEFQEATEKKMLEEQAKQAEMQEQINKDYEEMKTNNPEKIDSNDTTSLSLKGSDNFLKVALTFMQLKKSNKKGGKIFIKVSRPKKVSIEWTTKDVRFVEFWSINERGDKVKEITRVSEYKYTFDGTSIPVLFAVQGIAESYDFYDAFRRDLTSETVSGIAMESYNAGYKDGLVLNEGKQKNSILAMLTEFMPLILILGFLVMIVLLWQMYDSTLAMQKAIELMQNQIANQLANPSNVMVVS